MTRAIFLDDGDVLSDNARRHEQWTRLAGEYLARELGGDPARWAKANRYAVARVMARLEDPRNHQGSVREYVRRDVRVWLADMCAAAGVPRPSGDVDELAARIARHVTARVRAFFPDVVPTLRDLHARGYALHTASGAIEADLDGYLRAEGVRDLFGTLYGVDVVDVWKDGPAYYAAVFAHAGVRAVDAAVVDDKPHHVEFARAAGARAFRLDRARGADGADVLGSLDELSERL